jgi:hypothetical protein
MDKKILESASTWLSLQDGKKIEKKVEEEIVAENAETQSVKNDDDIISKMFNSEVRASLIATLDGDEILADNVIKNMAKEFSALIPNLLGKNS